jgi:hypothetical protein
MQGLNFTGEHRSSALMLLCECEKIKVELLERFGGGKEQLLLVGQ